MQLIKLVIFLIIVMSSNLVSASCSEDSKVERYKESQNNLPRFSNDGSYETYQQCINHSFYICLAKEDHYQIDGKEFPRTEQSARKIEDKINESIDKYNLLNKKICGELLPAKAIFAESIRNRKENVVGYWITEDKIGSRLNYTEYQFGNDNSFGMSIIASSLEKGSWIKTKENSYKITYSTYSEFNEKWRDPVDSMFVVDPATNTATYYFNDFKGNAKTSKWYFKGTAFNLYGIPREVLLKPVDVSVE